MMIRDSGAWTRSMVATGLCAALALPLAASAQAPEAFADGASRAATTGSPLPVRASKLVEEGPAADGRWLVWTQNSWRKPNWFNAFAQSGTRTPVRLNKRGTRASTGGVDGQVALYLQDATDGTTALYTYNLRAGFRHRLPKSATGDYPENPTISGRWVLFSRINWSTEIGNVVLYDRVTHATKTVGRFREDRYSGASAGQVNGRWAVWSWVSELAVPMRAVVVRYNIKTQVKHGITMNGFGAAVSEDGTVYFLRGHEVRSLIRVPVGGTPTVVAQLPGYPSDLFVKDRSDGRHAIYFQTSYGGSNVDVYKIIDN